MFPSTTLLSTREEWRGAANFLADLGYRSVLVDWPGWHQSNIPLNWSMEDEIGKKSMVDAFSDFAVSTLRHIHTSHNTGVIHVVCAGGNSAVYARRAMDQLGKEECHFGSLTCFSPSWRFYLPRTVIEGYPRKLARRQRFGAIFLSTFFVRSKMAFRIYKSKFGLAKLTRRLYDEKIQMNPELLEAKREVITRDRPLALDAAMIVGELDAVSSTESFLRELLGADLSTDQAEDSDDEDDGLLNLHVPQWAKQSEGAVSGSKGEPRAIPIQVVIPQDADSADLREMRSVRDWAFHSGAVVSEISGKLFAHEESPALSASILHEFFANPSRR